jgi:3-hydroxyacyl-CoA dehydrogenase
MVATGPTGPFAILDVVGITTAYNIIKWRLKNRGFR